MSSDGRVNNFTGEQKLPSSDAKPAFTVPPSPSRGNKNKASFFTKPFASPSLPTIAEPGEGATEGQHSHLSPFAATTAQQSTSAHAQGQGEPSQHVVPRLAAKKSRFASLNVAEEPSISVGEQNDRSVAPHNTSTGTGTGTGEHCTDVTMNSPAAAIHLGHTNLRVLPPSPMRQLSSQFTAKSLQLPPLVYPDNHAPIVMHDSSPPLQNAPASSHAPSARHPVAPSAASDGPSHRIHSPVAAVSCSRDGSLVECELRVAHHCEQGVRGSMEDEVIIEQNIDINGSSSPLRGPLSFYAVCDGHGGKNAAIFTRDNLNRVLMDDIKAGKEVPEALTAAFIKVDKDFIASGKDPSGTTAATLLLDQATGNVWVANVGDSRVVLSRAGEALPLSRDHRCDRQDEVERIRKAGGFVIQSRVMGELAVTRSIGDADFKDDELNLVIAEPEIEHNRLQDDDEFVLIACDGLFDVMTNEAAIAYVRQHLRKHNDPERAARDLVYHAIHELNTRDNVSVVLICLKDDYSAVVTPSS